MDLVVKSRNRINQALDSAANLKELAKSVSQRNLVMRQL
jgi:hypothetical protein